MYICIYVCIYIYIYAEFKWKYMLYNHESYVWVIVKQNIIRWVGLQLLHLEPDFNKAIHG